MKKNSKFEEWSNEKLRASLEKWAYCERKVSVAVIEHVAEAIARGSFVDWGYSNIKDYLVQGLKCSESAANRRISAAYATIQLPELKQEIENGNLNLTQIVQVQAAVRQEQKVNGKVSIAEKREIFGELLGKNSIETQKIIDSKFEMPFVLENEKHKRDDSVEVTVRMPKELYDKFMRIKELSSHVIYDGNWVDVLKMAADDCLRKRDPLLKKAVPSEAVSVEKVKVCSSGSNGSKQESMGLGEAKNMKQSAVATVAHDVNFSTIRKQIHPRVRRYIFQRDQVCQHKNKDGSLCGSRNRLEVDHIKPKFAGGLDEVENLRLLCRSHNVQRYRNGT